MVLAIAICGWLLSGRLQAAESPDDLYREGRYAEAEKEYARSDMDNPRDLRYRYNRGCAAYQSGDYQTAAAAFASVLRRSDNADIRFKAAFNLGNAAYRQGNFQAASDHFRQALGVDPSSADARYNLELSLSKLQNEEQQPGRDSADSPQPQDSSDSGDDDQRRNGASDIGDTGQKPTPEHQKADESGQSGQNQERADKERPQNGDAENHQAEQQSRPEPKGELKPRGTSAPAGEGQQAAPGPVTPMDRKKAEALLDNIQEDRTQLMRLQTQGRRSKVASGKDW